LALGALVRVEVVDAVEDAEQGRLAATRRPDEGGDLAVAEADIDGLQGQRVAIVEAQVADEDLGIRPSDLGRGWLGGGNHGLVHFDCPRLEKYRAPTFSARTATVMIRAPVQASCCHSG